MRRPLGLSVALLLTLSLVAVGGNTAAATSTLWVNDNDPNLGGYAPPGSSCNNPGYQAIQSAVNAAGPGATINVCPGTYEEQVVLFGAGKNNIRLRSVSVWQAIIKAPFPMIPDPDVTLSNSIVRVDGAQNVQILGFTITGPGQGICDTATALHFGVNVKGGGSADIFGNHITHIRDDPVFLGCQSGTAVQVGRDFGLNLTTGRARIIGNVIDDYNKNGITVDNVGSHAEIAYNRVIGAGPTILTAQNGMQISRGATANVRHNFVSSNDYTGSPAAGTGIGILVFDSGLVRVDRNTVNLNGVGIIDVVIFSDAGAGTAIKNNTARASTFDGIVLQDVSDRLVQTNKSSDNLGPGISLYGANQSTIKSNWVTSNRDTGILLDNGGTGGADENGVRYNVVSFNGTIGLLPDTTDGIRINPLSTLNTIANNRLKNNVTHDCHDGSTGNTWTNNEGETSFPTADLCEEDEDADKDCDDSNHGWDRHYKWNAEFGVPADVDFTAAYATVDIDGLLAQLPSLPTSLGLKATSPVK